MDTANAHPGGEEAAEDPGKLDQAAETAKRVFSEEGTDEKSITLTRGQREALMLVGKIFAALESSIKSSHPMPPDTYLNHANDLLVLKGHVTDIEIALEMQLARIKAAKYEQLDNMSAAEEYAKTTPTYEKWRKLKARGLQIDEYVRISKKRAELAGLEFRQGA